MEERIQRATEYSRRVNRIRRKQAARRSIFIGAVVKTCVVFAAGVLACMVLVG